MTAKEYLLRSVELKSRIDIKSSEVRRCEDSEAYAELERYKEDLINLEKELTSCILKVEDVRYRKILYWLYIEGKKMTPLVKEMQYEYHYLCSLHSKALKEFERVNKDKLEGLEGE